MTTARELRDLGADPVWVRIRGVSKRYGRRTVLSDVDVCLRPGRVTALLGPNGAGKTTLIGVLLGLVRPDGGEVEFAGRIVGDEYAYRGQVGYMPQLPRFPENLSGRDLFDMLDDVRGFRGEPDAALSASFELEEELDQPVRALSGGTLQKLNAAIALRYHAPVLVLDEPTAGLDPVAAATLRERILEERSLGRTIVLSSHELGSVERIADDVVFLVDGRVLFEGEAGDLLSHSGEADLESAMVTLLRRHRRGPGSGHAADDAEGAA